MQSGQGSLKTTNTFMKPIRFPRNLFAAGLILATGSAAHAAVSATFTGTAPTVGAHDQAYLPGSVDETATMTIDGANGTSGENDLLTYVANDRSSKGMSFTTGSNAGGYSLTSLSLQHIGWTTFMSNGTFYNLQNGDTFDLRIGTISGTTLTPIFTTTATYTGGAFANGTNSSGTGNFLTFDLSGVDEQTALGTLSANTMYFFEIASGTGDPFLELNSTAANGYAGGYAFRGDNASVVDADGTVTLPPNGGDFAFHAGLTAIPEPSAALLGGLGMLGLLRRRRH